MGVGFFLNALGIPGVRELVVQGWPVVFVIIGLGELLTGNPFNGVFWCLLGVVASLFTSGTVSYTGNLWSIIWPLALALIGLRPLLRPVLDKRARSEGPHFADSSVVLGGTERRVESKDFKGSTVNAIFGGAKLDLREAQIAEEGAVIDVSVVFGGVEIVVPEQTPVRTQVTTVVGGVSDERRGTEVDESRPALTIRGEVIFGGVEIKE